MKEKRNKDWYWELLKIVGDSPITNRDLYEKIDQVDKKFGISTGRTDHINVSKKFESLSGVVEVVIDKTRKGHGREIPKEFLFDSPAKVMEKLYPEGEKAKEEEIKEAPIVLKKREPVMDEKAVKRMYNILQAARRSGGMVSSKQMIDATGRKSVVNTAEVTRWFADMAGVGIPVSWKYCGKGLGWKIEAVDGAIKALGEYADSVHISLPYKKLLGIDKKVPAHIPPKKEVMPETPATPIVSVIPSKERELTMEEHKIIYIAAGIIRMENSGKAAIDVANLCAAVSKQLGIQIIKKEFMALLSGTGEIIISNMGFDKARLKNGEESWAKIKAKHSPENLPKREVLIRIGLSPEELMERGFADFDIEDRLTESDFVYRIRTFDTRKEDSRLRLLRLTFRGADKVYYGKGLFDRLLREMKKANSDYDSKDLQNQIESEIWLEEEAVNG